MLRFGIGVFAALSVTLAFASGESGADGGWNIKVNSPKAIGGNGALWGVSYGAYFPKSGEIRDLFGDSMPRYGISPVSKRFDKQWDVNTDINILTASGDDAHLLLIPFTVGASMAFGGTGLRTYVAANAGPAYYDYKLQRDVASTDVIQTFRKKKIGWNTNFEAGILINKRFSVVARYDLFSKSEGFDFSGFSINANYAFFKW